MIFVLTTLPGDRAKELQEKIVREKLAGCAIALPIKSVYWWKSKIEKDEEVLVIFKTLEEREKEIKKRIRELHPYEVPFIAVLRVDVNEDYLNWLKGVLA